MSAAKLIDANVAFSPADEDWMPQKNYRDVGAAFLVGVITSYEIEKTKNSDKIDVPIAVFEVRWTNTAFQKKKIHAHQIPELVVARGVKQYVRLQKNNLNLGESWSALCSIASKMSNIPALTDEFEEMSEDGYKDWSTFREHTELPSPLSPAEVETIKSMTFTTTDSLAEPATLFTHEDGTSKTKINDGSRKSFDHSATSSFFAFLPLSFWKQVVEFSNEYASAGSNASCHPIQLGEMMQFLGILWYMSLFKKGEMLNYWRDSEEATILPGASSTSLEVIMPWKRFLYIRRNLAFRSAVTLLEIHRDPAARIRPLINMVKHRCTTHVTVGRDVAVDEASIACRSQYARHIVVFNQRKPTGKYHFKLYMCCCSTSWYVVSFKLHCASNLEDRLDGVLPTSDRTSIAELTKHSSDVRSHVIEVTASLRGTRRVVNTDNFYTSCLLLESIGSIGLYGRGTVRQTSQLFPKYTIIEAKHDTDRGRMNQGVCVEKHIVAASWVDGAVVSIVSNADSSGTSTVHRRIGQTKVASRHRPASRTTTQQCKVLIGTTNYEAGFQSLTSIPSRSSIKSWPWQ